MKSQMPYRKRQVSGRVVKRVLIYLLYLWMIAWIILEKEILTCPYVTIHKTLGLYTTLY